jgi:hypothetical protein
MGLDMWFQADVARILSATHEAMQATAAAGIGGEQFEGYREGFCAALRAVAAGFGLPDPALGTDGSVRRSDAIMRTADHAAGPRPTDSAAAPGWRRTPADDRQWAGHVVDGEVLHNGRAYP